MRHLILIIFLTITLFSCGKKDKVESEAKQEERLRLETLKKLALQYDAVVGFDTLKFYWTYRYQAFLGINNRIVLDKFGINDIIKLDTGYVISIERLYPKLFIDLTCNEAQIKELLNTSENVPDKYKSYDKIIVAAITSVHKVKYRIDSNIEGESDEETTIDLDLASSNVFILKGKLIHVYKNQNP